MNKLGYFLFYFHSEPPVKRRKLYKKYPTPSSASQMTIAQRSNIKDHRGTGSNTVEGHGIHVSLMWEGFADFITLQTSTPTSMIPYSYLEHARKLRELMSLKHDSPKGEHMLQMRLQEALRFLGNFTPTQLEGGSKTDLTLFMIKKKVISNIKIKSEFGKGGTDAVLQNFLYYVHINHNDLEEGLDPMLLITMVGFHYFQVFGAVFGPNNEVLCDPLCDPVSLLNVPIDPLESEEKFACLLYTIKCTISQLETYYEESHPTPIRVPYYNKNNIQYIQPIYESGRIWIANMNGTEVVVKFTLTYNSTVQQYLHSHGMAPQLIVEAELNAGWKVIVMEYIEGKTLHECRCTLRDPQKDAIRKKLKEAIQSMRDKKYVHGDLRQPNIMIKNSETGSDSPTPIIVDFDWAGIEGVAKYPLNLNQVVDWPSDAKSGLNILNSHDIYMVENLF